MEKVTIPTKESIRQFSMKKIAELPYYYDLDNIKPGSFAKFTFRPDGPYGLVYIVAIKGHYIHWCWVNVPAESINPKAGMVSFVRKGIYGDGDSFFTVYSEDKHDNSQFVDQNI